jgi:hypothetical protein
MRIADARLVAVSAAAALALAALAGCQSAPAPVPTSTTATDAPIFASDEEALAAATEAYAAYLKASDDSWSGGPTTREDFLALSTGQAHEDDVAANKLFIDSGWRKVGTASFDSMKLESSAPITDGRWEIRTYACLDVSQGDVVDSVGKSVAKSDRALRMPLELAFETASTADHSLLLSESRVWAGSNFC